MTMSSESPPDQPYSVTLPIAEAAKRLGVSERTVYRMLREGKLERVIVSDNRQTFVTLNKHYSSQIEEILSDKADSLSDKASQVTLRELKEEMREKDRLISNLLENQREMIQTIHSLQEQLRELSQWVLAQKSAVRQDLPANKTEVSSVTQDKGMWIARLFQRGGSSRGRGHKE